MTFSAQDAILQTLRSIPEGKVTTYGRLAHMSGLGRAARYVGTTLRKLPSDTRLPWHRVINSQGKIAFPEHHPNRVEQEKRLLEEGIPVRNGKINLKEFLWEL